MSGEEKIQTSVKFVQDQQPSEWKTNNLTNSSWTPLMFKYKK